MATTLDINTLILMVGSELLTSVEIGRVIDLNTNALAQVDLDASAAQVWEIRAGRYHGLVDISESGSSRKMSDLHKNALAMAATYRAKATVSDQQGTANGRTGTRKIIRL